MFIVKRGDLVKIGKNSEELGIVIYAHPTKSVVQVYWPNIGFNWESCARLEIISSCAQSEVYPDHALHDGALQT